MLFVATTEAASTAPEFINWLSYAFILVVAAGFSLGLRRLGSLEEQHNLRRWVPAAHVAIWTIAASLVVMGVASYGFTTTLVLLVLALVALGAAGLGWLRSILAGLVLFSEAELSPGDRVQVGEYQGEVVSVGIRALRIRDVHGSTHDIPHARLVEEPLSRFPDYGDVTCTIDVELASNDEPDEVLKTLRTVVGLAPLASPRRRPEAFLMEPPAAGADLRVRVRAYPCAAEHREAFRSDILRRVSQRFSP